MGMKKYLFPTIAFYLLLSVSMNVIATPKCLWISSYAPGYEWNDGISEGLHSVLDGKCEVKEFHMDTKRNKGSEFGHEQALHAKALIESYKPDVVIASDDNASKYLIAPYYKNADLPIVVCAINWTAKGYGYPYKNVTGMIEVMQIKPLLKMAKKVLSISEGSASFIVPNTNTGKKNAKYIRKYFAREGFDLKIQFVNDFKQWKNAFINAQQDDIVFMLTTGGVTNWNKEEAKLFVAAHGKKLSISVNKWVKDYAMIVYAKRAEEQGEWAAKVALKILDGTPPSKIPMTVNKQWERYFNKKLLDKAGISVGRQILNRAITG
ncbi:MAG: hypothetical protein HOE12_00705 [Gammaproteobacteria bacterium]|nr:hypothetical protein [Gammaproteobacteria bacterium]